MPNSFIAARRDASGSSPRSIRSWMLIAMCPRISSSNARVSGRMRYSSPAGAGFITRPIASTSSDQRSCSRSSWALPAGVSR